MKNCALCGGFGVTIEVFDAADTKRDVHKSCWVEVQFLAGQMKREATKNGVKVHGVPRKA